MEESMEFIDQSIEAESMLEIPDAPKTAEQEYTPPPPPPKVKEEVEEIFKVVEDMPRFPGCEDLAVSSAEKRLCAEKALFRFINENLHYPSVAWESNIQGNVVVQFVVNKDGSIQDVTILRDIGAGCGDEVVRVVKLMNQLNLRWIPGKQRGTPVRVMFVLPVKFSLLVT
jgi:protein TonB